MRDLQNTLLWFNLFHKLDNQLKLGLQVIISCLIVRGIIRQWKNYSGSGDDKLPDVDGSPKEGAAPRDEYENPTIEILKKERMVENRPQVEERKNDWREGPWKKPTAPTHTL